jgi:ATP citrate (pro-S)-lyase
MPITAVFKEDIGMGGVISLLWFQRRLPDYACKFVEMSLMVTADHGPAVSGAHNTIVAARAGKDLVSSLCSGLLTIGDRFGGALDGAARMFSEAYDAGLAPRDFVNSMRKQHKLIMGIGRLARESCGSCLHEGLWFLFARGAVVPVSAHGRSCASLSLCSRALLIFCLQQEMCFSSTLTLARWTPLAAPGHKVKSITNPDMRVVIIKDFVKKNFPKTPLLDYALKVEEVTTAKKPNLILNVDGVIAVAFVDVLRECVRGGGGGGHTLRNRMDVSDMT